MRDAYVAQPSRLIAPADEKALLNKLLHDPRGERVARRRFARVTSACLSVSAEHPGAAAAASEVHQSDSCGAEQMLQATATNKSPERSAAVPTPCSTSVYMPSIMSLQFSESVRIPLRMMHSSRTVGTQRLVGAGSANGSDQNADA